MKMVTIRRTTLLAAVTMMVLAGCDRSAQSTTPAPAVAKVDEGAALREKCISQAKTQGYRHGSCAYSFIKSCIETQSRSEMEATLRTDAMMGIGTALSCPNMPTTYVADFDKF